LDGERISVLNELLLETASRHNRFKAPICKTRSAFRLTIVQGEEREREREGERERERERTWFTRISAAE
jgi:hypothetical protein